MTEETMDILESKNHGQRDKTEEQKEGPVAKAIEEQTAKIPSDVFLWAAGAAILGSLAFQVIGTDRGGLFSMFRRRRATPATFIGMWAPTILLLGIYNKIVKVAGSDRYENRNENRNEGTSQNRPNR
ncbi:MAG: hypothetical protein U0441_30070 [Polyangiaceae bacterium]